MGPVEGSSSGNAETGGEGAKVRLPVGHLVHNTYSSPLSFEPIDQPSGRRTCIATAGFSFVTSITAGLEV